MSVEEDPAARLYGLPLEDFVAARDEAARAARVAGRKEEAAAIGALRKPTLAAWAVNRLARESRRDVDLLLDSGRRLLDAQRQSLERGGRDDLDRARTGFDNAVTRLVEDARRILGDRASEGTLTRVASTLRTAAIQPDARGSLATGTLVKELSGTGWDVLADLGVEIPTSAADGREGRGQAADRRRLRDELRAARERRDEAAARLRQAERDEARAARALEDVRARRERAESDLAEAEDEIARAQDSLDAG